MDRLLHTPRLTLRAPQPGDAAFAFARWASDAQALHYLAWPPHTRPEQTHRLLDWEQARWLKKSAFTWLLLPRDDNGPIGQIQLLPHGAQGSAPVHHLRLGYVLAAPWQGRGLMREALHALLAHALAQPEVWRVDALCDVANHPSRRLLEALGMHCEGKLARRLLLPQHGPEPRDAWLYASWRTSGCAS